jgi:hypothetical protein
VRGLIRSQDARPDQRDLRILSISWVRLATCDFTMRVCTTLTLFGWQRISCSLLSVKTAHTSVNRPECVVEDAVQIEPVSALSNSLLTGKLTGNFADSGHSAVI